MLTVEQRNWSAGQDDIIRVALNYDFVLRLEFMT